MRVVGFVAQRRLARHWRALIAAGRRRHDLGRDLAMLIVAVLLGTVIADIVAVMAARRSRTAAVLREA